MFLLAILRIIINIPNIVWITRLFLHTFTHSVTRVTEVKKTPIKPFTILLSLFGWYYICCYCLTH